MLSKAVFHLCLTFMPLLLCFVGYLSGFIEIVLWAVYMYITYRQLFGYGWWGTLWRLFTVLLSQLAFGLAVVFTIMVLTYDEFKGFYTQISYLIIMGVLALLTAVILYISHRIYKRTYHNNIEISKETNPI